MMILRGITDARQWFTRTKIEGVYQQSDGFYFNKVKLCPGDYILVKGMRRVVFRVNHGIVRGD